MGFIVDAFDEHGEIAPQRVSRLFRGITTEWLVLSCGLTVTPGHCFLNENGEFERVDNLIGRKGKIVLEDGTLQSVTAERITYSEATAHLYKEAEEVVYASVGGAALQLEMRRGWRTYNFEVEEYHTYIAGGVRVHNDSLQDYLNLSVMMRNDANLAVAFDSISQRFGTAAAATAAYGNESWASPTNFANHVNDMIDAYAEAIANKDFDRAEAIRGGLSNVLATGFNPAIEQAQEMVEKNQNSSVRPEAQNRLGNLTSGRKIGIEGLATMNAIKGGRWKELLAFDRNGDGGIDLDTEMPLAQSWFTGHLAEQGPLIL